MLLHVSISSLSSNPLSRIQKDAIIISQRLYKLCPRIVRTGSFWYRRCLQGRGGVGEAGGSRRRGGRGWRRRGGQRGHRRGGGGRRRRGGCRGRRRGGRGRQVAAQGGVAQAGRQFK